MKTITLSICLLLLCTQAWSDEDHNEARSLRLQGEILPLTQILKEAEKAGLDTILEAELEKEDGQWCYEIEGLSEGNEVIELLINAKTGEIIRTEYEKKSHKGHD